MLAPFPSVGSIELKIGASPYGLCLRDYPAAAQEFAGCHELGRAEPQIAARLPVIGQDDPVPEPTSSTLSERALCAAAQAAEDAGTQLREQYSRTVA